MALVLCAMTECNQYLTVHCKRYLKEVGFDTASDMAKFCGDNPEGTFSLQVLLTAILNGIHICILTPQGDLHTHLFQSGNICHCAFYAALTKGKHGLEYTALQELTQNKWDELKCWVNCEVPTDNVPRSVKNPGKKFTAAKTVDVPQLPLDLSIAKKKTDHPPSSKWL